MAFKVSASPGITVREIDLTTVVRQAEATDGFLAGEFNWGPVDEVMTANNEEMLVKAVGKPSNLREAISFLSASSFLSYTDKLRYARVGSSDVTKMRNAQGFIEVKYLDFSPQATQGDDDLIFRVNDTNPEGPRVPSFDVRTNIFAGDLLIIRGRDGKERQYVVKSTNAPVVPNWVLRRSEYVDFSPSVTSDGNGGQIFEENGLPVQDITGGTPLTLSAYSSGSNTLTIGVNTGVNTARGKNYVILKVQEMNGITPVGDVRYMYEGVDFTVSAADVLSFRDADPFAFTTGDGYEIEVKQFIKIKAPAALKNLNSGYDDFDVYSLDGIPKARTTNLSTNPFETFTEDKTIVVGTGPTASEFVLTNSHVLVEDVDHGLGVTGDTKSVIFTGPVTLPNVGGHDSGLIFTTDLQNPLVKSVTIIDEDRYFFECRETLPTEDQFGNTIMQEVVSTAEEAGNFGGMSIRVGKPATACPTVSEGHATFTLSGITYEAEASTAAGQIFTQENGKVIFVNTGKAFIEENFEVDAIAGVNKIILTAPIADAEGKVLQLPDLNGIEPETIFTTDVNARKIFNIVGFFVIDNGVPVITTDDTLAEGVFFYAPTAMRAGVDENIAEITGWVSGNIKVSVPAYHILVDPLETYEGQNVIKVAHRDHAFVAGDQVYIRDIDGFATNLNGLDASIFTLAKDIDFPTKHVVMPICTDIENEFDSNEYFIAVGGSAANTSAGGGGAVATATHTGGVVDNSIVVTNGGESYDTAPRVVIDEALDIWTVATVDVDGTITGVTAPAHATTTGYNIAAGSYNAIIKGTGFGARIELAANGTGGITGFTIVSGGTGYTVGDKIYAPVIPKRGSGAVATSNIENGVITAMTVVTGGAGYAIADGTGVQVRIINTASSTNGINAVATVDVAGGVISNLQIVDGGQDYMSSGFALADYTTGVAIAFTTAATFTTTVKNGVVKSIEVVEGGTGYVNPVVRFAEVCGDSTIRVTGPLPVETTRKDTTPIVIPVWQPLTPYAADDLVRSVADNEIVYKAKIGFVSSADSNEVFGSNWELYNGPRETGKNALVFPWLEFERKLEATNWDNATKNTARAQFNAWSITNLDASKARAENTFIINDEWLYGNEGASDTSVAENKVKIVAWDYEADQVVQKVTLDDGWKGPTGPVNIKKIGVATNIKNDAAYDAMASKPAVEFVARYPGDFGNSLQVLLCANAVQFSALLPGVARLTKGSKEVVYWRGGNTTAAQYFGVGDQMVVGKDKYLVVAIQGENKLILDRAYAGATVSNGKIKREWKYASLFGKAPKPGRAHVAVIDRRGVFGGGANSVLELYNDLHMSQVGAKNADGTPAYWRTVMAKSQFIKAGSLDLTPHSTAANREAKVFNFYGGLDSNGSWKADEYIDSYKMVANPDTVDVSLIIAPELGDGLANATVINYIIDNICEKRKDCMVFFSPLMDNVLGNIGKEVTDIINYRDTITSSSYAVMDCNWKYMFDRYNNVYRWVPCAADVAGLVARTEQDRGAWWSPAGFNRGIIKNAIKLAWEPIEPQRDDLYTNAINPITNFRGTGNVLFGDKTMYQDQSSAFAHINVRRLFIVIEKAIATAAKQFLFEFNDEFTRARFVAMVEPFLREIRDARGIYDFRVVCDESNNTGQVIDQNGFVGDIYIKPARSINYITLNFVAVRTDVSFEEVVGTI